MVTVDLLTFSLTTYKALRLHWAAQGASTLADILIRDGVMVSLRFSKVIDEAALTLKLYSSQYYALVLFTTTATMVALYVLTISFSSLKLSIDSFRSQLHLSTRSYSSTFRDSSFSSLRVSSLFPLPSNSDSYLSFTIQLSPLPQSSRNLESRSR